MLAACLLINFAWSQTDYSDVAVIVNDNSSISQAVGTYFRQARSIPSQNIIHISVPETEVIDSAQFEDLRNQIESYLISNNLADSFNYLVTTKGVPMRVERANCTYSPNTPPMNCTSVESELTLLFSANAGNIGSSQTTYNPYYSSSTGFDHSAFDMYLVTRLDGFTYEDITDMIDRSGPATPVNQLSSYFVVDHIQISSGDSLFFAPMNQAIIQAVQTNGWNAMYDPASPQLTGTENMVGYFRYEGMSELTPIGFGWVPGSIAEHLDYSFDLTFTSSAGQENKMGDFISKGASGGHALLFTVFFSQISNGEQIANHYSSGSYNLAESFYAGIQVLSSTDVVFGDPKTTIFVDNLAEVGTLDNEHIQIGPNPSNGQFTVFANGRQVEQIAVYDMTGRTVYHSEDSFNQSKSVHMEGVQSGTYLVKVTADGTAETYRIAVAH